MKRCPHGFDASSLLCVECHPDLSEMDDPHVIVCALCENIGHVAKNCNHNAVGRRRKNPYWAQRLKAAAT